MVAPVSPTLLIALVTGSLGQFLCLGFQQPVEGLLYATSHKFLELPLDYSLSCTIFSDMVCCLLSEWCVATSFYQSSANHVSFVFAKLILPYLIFHLNPMYKFLPFHQLKNRLLDSSFPKVCLTIISKIACLFQSTLADRVLINEHLQFISRRMIIIFFISCD